MLCLLLRMALCLSCVLFPRSLFSVTVVILMFGCILSPGLAMNEKDAVLVAKCRAKCIKTFLEWPLTDNKCLQSPECYMCWDMCERVAIQYEAWSPVCSADVCGKGCKLACDFLENDSGNYAAKGEPWVFFEEVEVVPLNDEALEVAWSPPAPVLEENKMADKFVVYTLLYRFDSSPDWASASMCLSTVTQVDGPHKTFPGLSFRLLVINEEGVVAEAIPAYASEDVQQIGKTEQPTSSTIKMTTTTRATKPPTTTTTTSAPFTSTTTARTQVKQQIQLNALVEQSNGVLHATLLWDLPQGGDYECTVTWRRMSCSVDDAFPGCLGDDALHKAVVYTKTGQDSVRFPVPFVTYNSHYDVKMNCDNLFTGETNLLTLGCMTPLDNTLIQCGKPEEVLFPQLKEDTVNWFLILTCLAVGILLFLVIVAIFYIVYKKCHLVSANKWEEKQLHTKYLEHRLSLASLPTMNTQLTSTPQGLAQMNLLMKKLKSSPPGVPSYDQASMMRSQYGHDGLYDEGFESFLPTPTPSPKPAPRCGLQSSMVHLQQATPLSKRHDMSSSMYSLNKSSAQDRPTRQKVNNPTHYLAVPSQDVFTDDDEACVSDNLLQVPSVPVYKRSMSDIIETNNRVQNRLAASFKRSFSQYNKQEEHNDFETVQERFLEFSDVDLMEEDFMV